MVAGIGVTLVDKKTAGDITSVLLRPKRSIVTFTDLMYRMNHVITGVDGKPLFDSPQIAAHADTDKFRWLIERSVGEQACAELANLELAFYLHLGDEAKKREIWTALFNHGNS